MFVFIFFFVLLVSATPVWANDFLLNADESVADLSSGLVWQGSSRKALTSQSAVDFCEQIDSKKYYSWRLPSQTELAELDTHLQTVEPSVYWASGDSTLEPGIYCFGDGAFFRSAGLKTAALVRCVSKNPLAPAIEAVYVWVESWQNGDIEGYLSSYVSEFKPSSAVEHSVWERQRRQRLSSALDISIELKTEQINRLDEKIVEIVFLQDYRSRHYQDRVRKRLLLNKQQGRWLIAKEEQLSNLPRTTLSAATIYYQ